jgi:hypothetical protein
MAEIMVQCAECNQDLEEFKTKLMWGGLVIEVIPCEVCLDNAKEEATDDSS